MSHHHGNPGTALLKNVAAASPAGALELMGSQPSGLPQSEAQLRIKRYGPNEVARTKPPAWYIKLVQSFANPFSGMLIVLAAISYVTDVLAAPLGRASWTKILLLVTMLLLGGFTSFWQEHRSMVAADKLKAMVRTTAAVLRIEEPVPDTGEIPSLDTASRQSVEIPIVELVPGDIIRLSAGDMVPADLRLIKSKDLFVSQAALTGESLPVEKHDVPPVSPDGEAPAGVVDEPSLCFMGTNVISGSALGVVVATGDHTYFGSMASAILGREALTSFDVGVRRVSWVLVRFTAVMVPVVFLINGLTKGDWGGALLFALAVAVGVTPEMMPMVVSANLAKGSIAMSRRKVIVKRLNSIQNLGAMDILCTDKTGTLTQDRVVLERHLDVTGEENYEVLRLAFLNSYHQTGLRNLLDRAVIDHVDIDKEEEILAAYPKIDEIPFDFMRRRMSVAVQDGLGRHLLICKGAVDEVFSVSSRAQIGESTVPFDDVVRARVTKIISDMSEDGMRVVAVAYKALEGEAQQKQVYGVADEGDLVVAGCIGFLDPPKETAGATVKALKDHGVEVKILTGDNELVTRKICRDVGIDAGKVVLGVEMDRLGDDELADVAERTTVFAKVDPFHKSRVIKALRSRGHTVGYLGDGINDAPALKDADVGISVDTAVDIAKESATVVLLEKSLTVLDDGIIQGREVFGNIVKYIKMATSSNFGNMLSVLPASAFLPFLPMLPIHILILNVVYDISQLSLPWDRMDEEFLRRPRRWDASGLSRFMLYIGPCSSVYDLLTFYLMWFVFRGWATNAAGVYVNAGLFQAGWFVESMMTQSLIIHMIRTRKVPFLQSNATLPVTVVTAAAITVICVLPFTSLGAAVGLSPLPARYWPWLVAIVVAYFIQTQLVKAAYIKKFGGEWL